ncbi:MAG: YdeI/OmpD-associated family protein [Kangiellaceae bacterium]|nr:YdeI/OmpD-associated family protein [Kangiellaceae bacterium]MCW9000742.1 YdeI/OmpD-associated family protein [Kangiellaceae bacterium]
MNNISFNTLEVKNLKQWRSWLSSNGDSINEIWLVFYKKSTGKAGFTYSEAVEQAICFGWIDGLKRKIDEQRYTYRFTPRKAKSKWSPLNIKRARKMITQDQMTPQGLTVFQAREEYDEEFNAARQEASPSLSQESENAIKQSSQAWRNFNQMAPGYRKRYVLWIESAKRPETKAKRLKQAIISLANNEKPF